MGFWSEPDVPPLAPSQANGRQIVVVEDDLALRNAICFSLEAEGYAVRAFDGGDILEAGDLGGAACFVLDQRLLDTDGLRLIRELRDRGHAAPMVLITTAPDLYSQAACLHLGVPIVEKPLLGESLNACIRGLIGHG